MFSGKFESKGTIRRKLTCVKKIIMIFVKVDLSWLWLIRSCDYYCQNTQSWFWWMLQHCDDDDGKDYHDDFGWNHDFGAQHDDDDFLGWKLSSTWFSHQNYTLIAYIHSLSRSCFSWKYTNPKLKHVLIVYNVKILPLDQVIQLLYP